MLFDWMSAKTVCLKSHSVNGFDENYVNKLIAQVKETISKEKNKGNYCALVKINKKFCRTDLFNKFVKSLENSGYRVSCEIDLFFSNLVTISWNEDYLWTN